MALPPQTCEAHKFFRKITETTAKLSPEEKDQYEKDADRLLRHGIIQLLVKQPFYGLLLCNLDRTASWILPTPTMAVDGEHLFYHPVFVMLCSRGEHRAVLCHECLHLAFLHITRRKGREAEKWNRAIDYAANQVVVDECELPIHSWACYEPEIYKGLTAEKIYKILDEGKGGGGGGKGKGKGKQEDGDGQGEGESQGKGQGQGSGGKGKCPDCEAENSCGGGHHVMDNHMQSPNITEDEIIDKVVRAAEQARSQGNLPAAIDTMLRRLRKPKVDWRKFIRGRALDIFNKKDYRYEIRSLITGPVAKSMGIRSTWLPGLGAEEAKILVVVIDTSGSISKGLLKGFAAETKGVMELADKTIVITADAAVHEVVEVNKFDDILSRMKFRGGGGTDFRPAFERVKKMGIDPELLIYFTDAWGSFPEHKARFPVIWALTKNHGEVPWGEAVVVTDNKDEIGDDE